MCNDTSTICSKKIIFFSFKSSCNFLDLDLIPKSEPVNIVCGGKLLNIFLSLSREEEASVKEQPEFNVIQNLISRLPKGQQVLDEVSYYNSRGHNTK